MSQQRVLVRRPRRHTLLAGSLASLNRVFVPGRAVGGRGGSQRARTSQRLLLPPSLGAELPGAQSPSPRFPLGSALGWVSTEIRA